MHAQQLTELTEAALGRHLGTVPDAVALHREMIQLTLGVCKNKMFLGDKCLVFTGIFLVIIAGI